MTVQRQVTQPGETNQHAANNNEKLKDSVTHPMIYVVFVALLIDLLAFTVILPLMPAILEHYSRRDESGLYELLLRQVMKFQKLVGAPPDYHMVLFGGALGSLFSFLQFLSAPIIGGFSDVYGRKPLMLMTVIGIAASYALWAMSQSFAVFVFARIIGGVSKGNVSLSMAVVSDVSNEKTRGRGMALIGVAFSVGFILGPMIGAFFSVITKDSRGSESWFVPPAVFALVLAVIEFIYIYFYFRETLGQMSQRKSWTNVMVHVWHYINPVSLFQFNLIKNLKSSEMHTLRRTSVIYFLYLLLYSGLEFTLSFLTHVRFEYTSMQQGRMYFVCGIIMATVQGGYVRKITPGKEKSVAVMGMLLIIPSYIVIGFAQNEALLYAGLVLYSFASATVVPCLTTLVSLHGSNSQKGTVMGIFRSLGSLARALGPIIASSVFWRFGMTQCYVIGGMALLVPFYMLKKSNV